MRHGCSHPRFSMGKQAPRTSGEVRADNAAVSKAEIGSEAEGTLQKWVDIFDGNAINLPELKSEARAASLASYQTLSQLAGISCPPNIKSQVQGVPINLETAKALRRVLFGDATHTFTKDWNQFHFKFRESDCSIPYGLQADMPASRSLALCVMAYVVKHLLFTVPDEEEKIFGRAPPTPTEREQRIALIDALSDILWKLAPIIESNEENIESRKVVLVIPGDTQCFETLGYLLADGLIEKLWLYSFHTKEDLKTFIERNLTYFCNESKPGGILFVYSMVLSHTPQMIIKELANCQRSILTENARPTQAFHNLILSGVASCFLHNGTIRYDRLGRELTIPQPGLRKRSEMGFLYFDKTEEDDRRTEVGCMLRTPLLPIWITKVNGSYGILFCTSIDLVADWKTERFFSIHYYTGHFSQTNPTCINIDTRRRACPDPSREISYWDDEEEKERKQPSLERLLGTKWPDAILDWNGETPYY